MLNLRYQKATLEDLELLVTVRCRVLRGGVLLLLALGLTALLSWPLFALLGFPMPERLALLFFLIGGADLFRKLSQERDELVRKLLRLKLPGGRKGVTEQ